MMISEINRRVFKRASVVIIVVLVVGLLGGNHLKASEVVVMKLDQMSAEKWNVLAKKRIFFGHHSVGANILDGVDMVKSRNPAIKLDVVKLDGPEDFAKNGEGILGHAYVGDNFAPKTKVDDFSFWVKNGVGRDADYAFMKFCFVDIGTLTDKKELFSHYKESMAELKEKYPTTTLIHVTVPLYSESVGFAKWKQKLKRLVKNVLGKNDYYENTAKFTFNQMLRNEYNGKEPVFDLAAIESTFMNGSRSTFSAGGQDIESMVPEYSDDGGHLSPIGKQVVAEKFLMFLANLD
ncbi:hypothetical protein [Desulforhopalus sp. IMCC35007]|uniref:hypothetical protein n=1 Tax=Desulforhopalus sp. IMCC35007 TaxID=2569543 RepID=UPI0010ADDBE8|nr:hypothetical protein [Desulforhopalus sp. IMCC35007]TKB07426.1 hypothetical protein FCL48_16935 [Desulforhopalus sp. IMCC35007]